MKIHKVDRWHLSFLKGTWVEDNWVPLPSRILKIGICKEDPARIYRKPLREAMIDHLHGIACSIASASDVPILCAFIAKYLSSGQTEYVRLKRVLHVDLHRSTRLLAPYTFFANYYAVPIEWFSEVEAMIVEGKIPFLAIHPLFEVMAIMDYG